jgi:hypothetical protein
MFPILLWERATLELILSPSTVERGDFWASSGETPRRRQIGGLLTLRRLLRQREDGEAPIYDVYIV